MTELSPRERLLDEHLEVCRPGPDACGFSADLDAIEAAAVAEERARLQVAVEAIDPGDYVDTRTALNVRSAVLALLDVDAHHRGLQP